jgi:hypothetical protein
MSEHIDVAGLAGEIADAFVGDFGDDYDYARARDDADALLKLIRAVVRQEVETHTLRSREDAETHSKSEAERSREQEYERSRCVFQDAAGRWCTLPFWHEETLSPRDHHFGPSV